LVKIRDRKKAKLPCPAQSITHLKRSGAGINKRCGVENLIPIPFYGGPMG